MKKESFEWQFENDAKISFLCSEASDLLTDLEIYATKDRGVFEKKKSDYKHDLKKIKNLVTKIEKLVAESV